jgi:hypothetical protein
MIAGDKSDMPGMVRASFGCYNTEADVDALLEILERIARREYRGTYVQEQSSGAFLAQHFAVDTRECFSYLNDGEHPTRRPYSEAS